ncbi:MAG: hypothetical protein JSV86_16250 [Gemmatimonadota bacterium]|nr:MAG: hypothetical protein JSV86_16250 [Gemmatimonadota bacterium]
MSSPCSSCPPGRSTLAALVGAALLAALWTLGCGPKFRNVYGVPLENVVLSAPIEDGWVAVDSAWEGVRAVLQLETEAPRGTLPWDLEELALLFRDDTIPATRMRCEESAACRRVARPVEPPDEREIAEPAERGEEVVELCEHIVVAEFVLPRVPTPADSVALRLGGRSTLLEWRR